MTKSFQLKPLLKTKAENVRVKIVKAPFIDTAQLRSIIYYRSKAVVL